MESPLPHPPEILLSIYHQLSKLGHFILDQLQHETPSEHHFVHKDQQEFDFLEDMCLGDKPPITAEDLNEG